MKTLNYTIPAERVTLFAVYKTIYDFGPMRIFDSAWAEKKEAEQRVKELLRKDYHNDQSERKNFMIEEMNAVFKAWKPYKSA